MAGKFQFETQNDPSSGRSTLQQGLRSNPSSTHLWLEVCTLAEAHNCLGLCMYSGVSLKAQ